MKQWIHTVTCQIQWVFRGRVAPCHRVRTFHVRHCNTLQHAATHCNTLQHPALHCNSISTHSTHESGAVSVSWDIVFQTLQHPATPCNTLPCNTHHFPDTCTNIHGSGCSEEKNTALFSSDTATHCNILQHHATHRNTRQHPATHISFQTHMHIFVGRSAPWKKNTALFRIEGPFQSGRPRKESCSMSNVLQCVAVCCRVLQRVNWLFSEEYIFFQTANKKKIPILYVTCAISSLRVSSGSSVQRNVENKASIFVFPLPDKFFVQFVGVLFEKKKKSFFL